MSTVKAIKKVKKVTFSNNTKKHDGVIFSERSTIFYKIICGYFEVKKFMGSEVKQVKTVSDIMFLTLFNDEILKYCNNRVFHCIKLLTNLKAMKIEENAKAIVNVRIIDEQKEERDDYWDHPMFVKNAKSRSCSGTKISIIHRGCRDFNLCLGIKHLQFLYKLRDLLQGALEYNKELEDDWVMIKGEDIEKNILENIVDDWVLV